jgi:hypothetical protein
MPINDIWGIKYSCIYLFLSFSIIACSLDSNSYKKWLVDEKNGWKIKKQVAEYIFDIQAKPTIYRQLANPIEKDSTDTNLYFDLSITVANQEWDLLKYNTTTEQEYHQKSYYFSYTFQKDIFLEIAGKKYPCTLFHFERSYDLAKKRTFVLGFDVGTFTENYESTLIIDSEVLPVGILRIAFSPQKLPILQQ